MPSWQAFPDESNLEEVKKIIEKYFSVYESTQQEGVLVFFVDLPSDEIILQKKFDMLRVELKNKNLIPFLREKAGEKIIYIAYKPPIKGKPQWVNLALFITTVITTMLSGAILFLREGENLFYIFRLNKLINGLIFFSIPLLAILGIHEFGHYFVSKKHGVAASLPFFIPIPPNPFLPLGTMGAVISMREPIPDRRALLDIGVAGPIAGFIVSIPVLVIGLYFMQQHPVIAEGEGLIEIHLPLLGMALMRFFSIPNNAIMHPTASCNKYIPKYIFHTNNAIMHPTAIAGWVGLLVTAINLLPAGQLDGGHIARAVLKDKHRYASFATIIFLATLTFLGLGNWLFLLLLLVFLIGTGHPPALNEFISLDEKRKLLAFIALLIFIFSFTPMPISAK